jgi:hypothetical protein
MGKSGATAGQLLSRVVLWLQVGSRSLKAVTTIHGFTGTGSGMRYTWLTVLQPYNASPVG